ncbi:MAG: hypothetical protein LBP56_01560 [Odoribacteraceae bacterium]|jgi:hypothetical protein|nr:hypothetical protein [Odoribacteraceae bacterium]
MFYARLNKIKLFNNREGFPGSLNCAELRVYSYVAGGSPGTAGASLSDLMGLPDGAARKQRLLDAVIAESGRFAQSRDLAINGVKNDQALLFGDAGLVIFSNAHIPAVLDIRLWVIESDEDARAFALDIDKVLDSAAFKGMIAAVEGALLIANPVLSGAIAVGSVVINLLRQKLRSNKDDLVGYWQATLFREQDYPHGARDRQDVYDTTGNMLVDYTLFGYENNV